jgi:hypothetical protein
MSQTLKKFRTKLLEKYDKIDSWYSRNSESPPLQDVFNAHGKNENQWRTHHIFQCNVALDKIEKAMLLHIPEDELKVLRYQDLRPSSELYKCVDKEEIAKTSMHGYISKHGFTLEDAKKHLTYEILKEVGFSDEIIAKLQVVTSVLYNNVWPISDDSVTVPIINLREEEVRSNFISEVTKLPDDLRLRFYNAFSIAYKTDSTDGKLEEFLNTMINAGLAADFQLIEKSD